jgi:hypothetical protein
MSSTGDNPLESAAGAAADIAHDTTEKLKGAAGDVASSVADAASRVAQSAPEIGARVQDSVDESMGFVRRQLRERPVVVLAVAALAALVFGYTMGRKSML